MTQRAAHATTWPVRITGLDLRYALLVVLHDAGRELTLPELVDRLRRWGLKPHAHTGVGPDGRTRRVRRGTFEAGVMPPRTTWKRMERAVAGRRRGLQWTWDGRGRRHLPIEGWPG